MLEDLIKQLISSIDKLTTTLEKRAIVIPTGPQKAEKDQPDSFPVAFTSTSDGLNADVAIVDEAPAADAPAAPAPATDAPATDAPAAPAPAPAPATDAPAPAASVSLDDLRQACLTCSRNGKMAVLKAYLASKSARRIQDLTPDLYADCYDYLKSNGAL